MTRIRRYSPRGAYIEQEKRPFKDGIFNGCLPDSATIPLLQHSGSPAIAVVKVGSRVEEGDVIGEALGNSVAVHASVPGVVRSIQKIQLHDGRICQSITLDLEGSFPSMNQQSLGDLSTAQDLGQDELLQIFGSCGLIHDHFGSGNLKHAFQEHIDAACDTLVLNVLETIPYLKVDTTLLKHRGAMIAAGFIHAIKALGASKVYVVVAPGLEKSCGDFFKVVNAQVSGLIIVTMSPRFPSHRPEVLLPQIIKKTARECVVPKNVGTMFLAPRTCLAIYEAVHHGRPLTESYVYLSGKAMARATVIKARIGTPLYLLFEDAGGLSSMPEQIAINNPLDGYVCKNIDMPVSKETYAAIALSTEETNQAPESECVHCALCIQGCPVYLEPELIYKLVRKGERNNAMAIGLASCTECGLCSYVCPSHIPLVQTFRMEKKALESKEGPL